MIKYDVTKGNWTDLWKRNLKKNVNYTFDTQSSVIGSYRPFYKQHLYYNPVFNHRVYQQPKIFPYSGLDNVVICVSSSANDGVAVLMTNIVPNLHFNGDSQCFPLYYYEERAKQGQSLFDEAGEQDYIRRDGVSDFILDRARKQYGNKVKKEDIFYYVYGILHNQDYRKTFSNDLKKILPRIPLVDEPKDFWKFSKAGRQLAELHVNYESVKAYPGVKVKGKNSKFYTVEKMRFPKKGQQDTIIYNSKITIENIPDKAYEYVVNGKSAIEWVMDRYRVTTHKDSGIANNPNDWADEVGKPSYILNLLLSVINVSVQTVDIVKGLPKMKFE